MATRRDDRYLDGVDLEKLALEQGWARGCEHCDYGLIAAPTLRVHLSGPDGYAVGVPLYMQRVYEHKAGLLTYCTCRAGQQVRKFVERKERDIANKKDIVPPTWNDALWAYCNAEGEQPTIHAEVV